MRKKKWILWCVVCLFFIMLSLRFWYSFVRSQSDTESISATVKASVCGNGVIEGGEDCEGDDLNEKTCVDLGYASGVLTCDIACSFDTSGCVAPTPTPTPTPTLTPTPALTPTATPTPTNTPTPTATSTPIPTATLAPTATSAPAATSTPAPAATATPGSVVTSTPVPMVLPTPAIPAVVSLFDINGSGRIEITEVFEAVKSWIAEWSEAIKGKVTARKCDLNRDGRCDLEDLSILLYYVGR